MAGQPRESGEGRRRDFLLTAGIILGSLIVLNLPPGSQRSVRLFLRETVLSPLLDINGAITRMRERALDFNVLRAQMDSITGLVAAGRTLAEENRQLREALGLAGRERHQVRAATVIRTGTPGAESVFLLDAGTDDGVRPFNAVATEAGLLGQVQEVYSGQAVGFDWSHRDFRASAMTPDGRTHGLVEAVRGGFREQDRLILRGTAYLADLSPGEELLTSGRGGTFPRGIRIGWIAEPAEASAGWSRSYYVEPAVYPGAATHAVVYLESVADMVAAVRDSAAGSGQADRR